MNRFILSGITTMLVLSTSTLSYADCSVRPSNESPITDIVGAAANPTGDPVGGGFGYSSTWIAAYADYVVYSGEQLLIVLEYYADYGDVIFLDPNGDYNLTGEQGILIPGGVTLASSRGVDGQPGAEIYTNENFADSLFLTDGEGVRLSGLRLRGPEIEYVDCRDCAPRTRGISSEFDRFEVDNCELSGWPFAAIHLKSSTDHHVHHNYIHHNHRKGLGYGVVVYTGADALIEANLFDDNRHAIAGDGKDYTSYEACFNIVGTSQVSHSFDMHGPYDNGDPGAGDRIYIHHNTFLDYDERAIRIRGMPDTCAWIEYNWFVIPSQSSAICQDREGEKDCRGAGRNSTISDNIFSARAFNISSSAQRNWYPLSETDLDIDDVLVGDFDGDGRDDLMRLSGNSLLVSSAGAAPWEFFADAGGATSVECFQVGHFDHDEQADLYGVIANASYIFSSEYGKYQAPNRGPIQNLRFGDFNGDGITDLFTSEDDDWKVCWGGVSAWDYGSVLSSYISLSNLRFADFDGNGTTDVFSVEGGHWQVSWSGASRWDRDGFVSSGYSISRFRFPDLDGNGIAEVFLAGGSKWYASFGGKTSWTELISSSVRESAMKFGDFDGDGRDDALWIGEL